MSKSRLLSIFIYALVFSLFVSLVSAAGEIVQNTGQVNYWTASNHTVTITNNGNESTNVTIPIPSGWTWVSGTTCTQAGTDIECLLAATSSGTYTVQSPGATAAEYTVSKFVPATNNSYTGNNVSMLRIQCSEIFHTLVEYGRGRGNYFYNSGSGAAGSGQTETGCAYLPTDTFIELNFLHKTYNVKQYFNEVADAYNATYTCTYPNSTIVRQHLDTSISRSSVWAVDFYIDEISGSWERFGYIGMQFDPASYTAGQSIDINCSNIQYYLPVAGGNMSCAADSFTLEFRNREPFIVSASSVGSVYNGTQEVEITYTITNNESYPVQDVAFEISAPPYAQFIGTRGELWGYATGVYRFERSDFLSGESETITLVARFDTTSAPSGTTTLSLTGGVDAEYTTCWEANAYNPSSYIQTVLANGTGAGAGIGNTTVDLNQNVTIINVLTFINNSYYLLYNMNITLGNINGTVNDIWNLSVVMNTTINNIQNTVNNINTTVNNIYTDTQTIIDMLDCDTVSDTPICAAVVTIINYVTNINTTVNNIENIVTNINTTVSGINNIAIAINNTVTNIEGNVTYLVNTTNNIYNLLNCSNLVGQDNNSVCNVLTRIENDTINIIANLTNIWGNYTAQDILDAIANISININLSTADINRILTEINRLREFDEEMVFLVTDAFNANQRASTAYGTGDMSTAITELETARTKLDQAATRLDYLKTQEEANYNSASPWWIWVILVSLIVVTAVFLFQKVPEDQQPPRRFE